MMETTKITIRMRQEVYDLARIAAIKEHTTVGKWIEAAIQAKENHGNAG